MFAKLSQLRPREQMGLSVACAFALFFVADRVAVTPVTRILNRMDIQLEVAEAQVAQNLEILRYKDSAKEQYEQVKNLIGTSGPEQETIEAFKSSVDEMALRNGVSLKSMQHLPPETTDFLVTYFVEVSDFESETLALINFLNDIQSAPGMLRIRKLSIASQEENSRVKGSLVISKVMTLAGEGE